MKLSKEIQEKLICPSSKSKLIRKGEKLESISDPKFSYPIVEGIPVLINEANSLFCIDDFVNKINTTIDLQDLDKTPIKKFLLKIFPRISVNIKAKKNYKKIASILPKDSKILVIGGSLIGSGMEEIYLEGKFEVIGSDVSFGKGTGLISDAHDIPFQDGTIDCVVVQAVLEHVLNPSRCVSEIYRVLSPAGLVYAETPFIQQVHMKMYDFTRFTHLGHRWLFKDFEEISSGPCCGPGMALAWSFVYFLRSFTSSNIIRRILDICSHLMTFYLKYFDYYLIDKPGSYDAASGYYFLGKKSQKALDPKELIELFKGSNFH